jgi:hypothetical protein
MAWVDRWRTTSFRIQTGHLLNRSCIYRANEFTGCIENNIDSVVFYNDLFIMYQLPMLFIFMLSGS